MHQRFNRRFVLAGLPLMVAGCAVSTVWSSDEDIARYAQPRRTGTPALTLVTVRNVGTGSGAHSALVIDASQSVIFDPAGSWRHPHMPERNDLLYGATPALISQFISYHSRETYYVVVQKVAVSAEVAEQAFALAKTAGPVRQSFCTNATSRLLQQLPGFESIGTAYFPEKLESQFARLPNVERSEIRETDSHDNRGLLEQPARVVL